MESVASSAGGESVVSLNTSAMVYPGFGLDFGTSGLGTYQTREEMSRGGLKVRGLGHPATDASKAPPRRSKSVIGIRSNYNSTMGETQVQDTNTSLQLFSSPKKDNHGRVGYHAHNYKERPEGELTQPPTRVAPPAKKGAAVVPQANVSARMERLEITAKLKSWHRQNFQQSSAVKADREHTRKELGKRDPTAGSRLRVAEEKAMRSPTGHRRANPRRKAFHTHNFEDAEAITGTEHPRATVSPTRKSYHRTGFVDTTVVPEGLEEWPFRDGANPIHNGDGKTTRHPYHSHNFTAKPEVSQDPHPDHGHLVKAHVMGFHSEVGTTENTQKSGTRKSFYKLGYQDAADLEFTNNGYNASNAKVRKYHRSGYEEPGQTPATNVPQESPGKHGKCPPFHKQGFEGDLTKTANPQPAGGSRRRPVARVTTVPAGLSCWGATVRSLGRPSGVGSPSAPVPSVAEVAAVMAASPTVQAAGKPSGGADSVVIKSSPPPTLSLASTPTAKPKPESQGTTTISALEPAATAEPEPRAPELSSPPAPAQARQAQGSPPRAAPSSPAPAPTPTPAPAAPVPELAPTTVTAPAPEAPAPAAPSTAEPTPTPAAEPVQAAPAPAVAPVSIASLTAAEVPTPAPSARSGTTEATTVEAAEA